ncbi:nitroreductase/quinone reductase family protein [Actinomadura rayongensis]|uniref:Nitroreductase family deazaflavin-dependent oxidoreductase n=1 Tax=Actinomadura rayongensis TaxID=1429076 RepID=A0A6I4WAU9_9ACTN|nr:nitroreductase/quinone reductase family protein [Actinomadura rayongensis]MXQ66788.1 nitroreductase family deazaflavin-dependent oxidoreductase [Actinomadura rayongensis]
MSVYVRLLAAHQRIYEASGGRVGHRLLGVPTLLLTTRGRRTGQRRTVALVYARDGDDLLVVASNGGSDKPPSWLLNLSAEPVVGVRLKRHQRRATARVVRPDDDGYDRLLALCDAVNRGRYSAYQRKTSRPIPIVALSPQATPKDDR